MSNQNPFDKPAAPSITTHFGTLRVITNQVELKKGASYIIDALGIDPDPDSQLNKITDDKGNLKEFRGKQLSPGGRNTHVIVIITTRNKDGLLYNACRDFMYWGKDVCQRMTIPSLQAHFGHKLGGIFNKSAEVHAEAVEIEDRGYFPQAFRIVKVFKTQAEREVAEQAHFSQLHQAEAQTADQIADEMLGEEPIPFGDEDDKPIGMSKSAAEALLPTLWTASGQDKDKFLAQLNGMPVVLDALGDIDAPEIAAFLI